MKTTTLGRSGREVSRIAFGARHVGHIADSLRAVDISLTDWDLDEIETIMADATPVAGPSPEGMP